MRLCDITEGRRQPPSPADLGRCRTMKRNAKKYFCLVPREQRVNTALLLLFLILLFLLHPHRLSDLITDLLADELEVLLLLLLLGWSKPPPMGLQ